MKHRPFYILALFVAISSTSCSHHDHRGVNSQYSPEVGPSQLRPATFNQPADPLGEPGSPETIKKQQVPLPE
jgi:hypothetical protein